MTEGNQFSSVVSPKEHSIHIFECSQYGKFESKCYLVCSYVPF